MYILFILCSVHPVSFFLACGQNFSEVAAPHKRLSRSDVGDDVTVTLMSDR